MFAALLSASNGPITFAALLTNGDDDRILCIIFIPASLLMATYHLSFPWPFIYYWFSGYDWMFRNVYLTEGLDGSLVWNSGWHKKIANEDCIICMKCDTLYSLVLKTTTEMWLGYENKIQIYVQRYIVECLRCYGKATIPSAFIVVIAIAVNKSVECFQGNAKMDFRFTAVDLRNNS